MHCLSCSDPTTATTDKTDTPSVGRLGTEDDCVYDSQDQALGVTILLAMLAFVLLTTNALTALCLYRCYTRRVPKSYARDTCELPTTVQSGGGLGAASNIYERVNTPTENLATTFTNPAAGTYSCHNICIGTYSFIFPSHTDNDGISRAVAVYICLCITCLSGRDM